MLELAPLAPLSVTQVNTQARGLLERQFASVCVAGEVTSTRVDGSGHRWFCLRDKQSNLSAVMFRRDAAQLAWRCADGDQVVARGRLTIYAASGRYQMVVQHLEQQGAGALQAAFERLKATLLAEGLFAASRKKSLPRLPRRVAVLSSRSGAVIRDIVHVATRRMPNCQLLLVPVRVQGLGCADDVVAALQRLVQLPAALAVDVVVLARGGGSLEDLAGFNDERLARLVAAYPLPTVSAIGHETDFTIADFVADVRAPTPSAAAELVFPQKSELHLALRGLLGRAQQATRRRCEATRLQLRAARSALGDGRRHALLGAQRLAIVQNSLQRRAHTLCGAARRRLSQSDARLQRLHPRLRLQRLRARHTAATLQLHQRLQARLQHSHRALQQPSPALLARAARRVVQRRRLQLQSLQARLEALSPLAVLQRGFSIVLDAQGRAVREAAQAPPGTALEVRLARGRLRVRSESMGP